MSTLTTRTYSPEASLSHPLKLIREIGTDISAGRELAWRLFVRDLSAQYRQTYLGFLWAFLPPLVASLTFIFLNSQGIVQIDTGSIPYPAFVMIGTLLWQVFVDAVTAPVQALNGAKPMLAKINFPREAILVAGFYMVLFNFAVRLVLLVGVMLWWHVPVNAGLAMFPLALGGLLLCGSAIGLAIAPLGALYGDVAKSIPIFAQFLMLLTPVVYPARSDGLAGLVATWNPVSPLIVTARESLSAHTFTLIGPFVAITALSAFVLFVGLVAFRIAMPHLIARMGG
jgi:lipopolysaccharide transport system permease protein